MEEPIITFDEESVIDFIDEIRDNQEWPYHINDSHFWLHEIVGTTCICSYRASDQRYFFKLCVGLLNGEKTIRVSQPSHDEQEIRAQYEIFCPYMVPEIHELLNSYFPISDIKEPYEE
jgi:hypothetical protein